MSPESVIEAIFQNAQKNPSKIAVVDRNMEISYSEFVCAVSTYARALDEKGVNSGERVMISGLSGVSEILLYFAIHMLRATAVVVDSDSDALEKAKNELKPNHVFLEIKDFADGATGKVMFNQFPSADDIADILFTTGTTGKPKGVMLSHRNEVAGASNVINGGEMSEEDINLLTMPMYHAYGITTLRACLMCGATVVLQDGVANLKTMLGNIKTRHCDAVYMVPASVEILYRQTRGDLAALFRTVNKIELCTAPVKPKLRRILMEQLKNCRIYNSYGSTESARSLYLRIDKFPEFEEAVGAPVEGVKVYIINNESEIKDKMVGHIAFEGGMNMVGYYQDEDLTAEVLRDGLFISGDLGYVKDGFVYIVGRDKDVINVGGEKVAPSEIETVINDIEGVSDCACVGVDDPDGVSGQIPVVFAVLQKNAGITADDVYKKTKEMEKYKRPYRIVEVDSIPTNRIGKLDRSRLKTMWEEIEK